MVFYFTSNTVEPAAFIYVGKDKVENEDLIKFGWEEDVWCVIKRCVSLPEADASGYVDQLCWYARLIKPQFHVDNLSSAHVYLRLKTGDSWTSIPNDLLEDCAQLTKANSIEGNKKDNVTIIYTPWSNLRKDASMATGQVSFHDQKMVKKVHVQARVNATVNRLNKTKVEKYPDLRSEKEDDLKAKRKADRLKREEHKAKERDEKKRREEAKWQKEHAYDELMNEDNMVSNQDRDASFYEDDFM